MTRRWLLPLAVLGLLVPSGPSQEKKDRPPPPPPAPGAAAKGPDLRFAEEGTDLVVRLTIEGPAVRQTILTDFTIFDGTPSWDEPPIGVTKPKRPPRVELRYLVLINKDLPGFINGGLMMVPTPEFVRKQQANEVVWRLPNYKNWGFRREEATFSVDATTFEAYSGQLKQAIPRMKQTIDTAAERSKGGKAP